MCLWLKLYTVPFFVSGQTYKISKGWNNYCSHCIRSHGWQCISEQKPSHEVEGTACRAQRQDCVEAQIWRRLPNWAIWGGPWKDRWPRTKNWAPEILCGDWRDFEKDNHRCNTDLGFMAEWPDGKPILSERHMKACLEFAKKASTWLSDCEKKRLSGLMKPRVNCLAVILSVMSGGTQAPLITCPIPSQLWSIVVAASCSGDVFQQQGLQEWSGFRESWMEQRTEIYLIKTWPRVLRTSDLAEGTPSNRTIILSTQLIQCRSGLGATLWIPSASGPARALTWTQ